MTHFRSRLSALALSSLLLAACQTQPGSSPTPKPPPPQAVEVGQPQRRQVDRVVELPADVRARRVAKVYSKISGHLRELRVDIGSRVKDGQVLAVLEAPEFAREAASAQATAAKAENDVSTLQAQQAAQMSQATASGAEAEKARFQIQSAHAELTQAQARYRFSRDSYGRLKAVYDEDHGLIARQQLDQAWSEVALGKGQVEAARQAERAAEQQARALERRHQAARLQVQALATQGQGAERVVEARHQDALKARDWEDYLSLRAPFSGVVTQRYMDTGALVSSQSAQPVLEVMDDSVVTVAVRVPELEAPRVRPGRAVEVKSEALPEEKFTGTVTRVAQALSADGDRTMLVEIDLRNPGHKLQPGMFVRCIVTLETHKGVLAVPSSAVLDEKGKTSVFLVESGKAVKKPVKVGFSNPLWSEIAEGLAGGETVVTKGKENLSDGVPLKVQ